MTNYNKRLDAIVYRFVPATDYSDKRETDPTDQERAKQAITSLIKELVAEAKPEIKAHPLGPVTLADCQRGLDHYESNLLKVLEEA